MERAATTAAGTAPPGFAEFVADRSVSLLRTAVLLTGDRGRAEDLVQEALARAWTAWPRIRREDRAEAYVRATMTNLSVSWWRRRWRGETPTERLPERADGTDATSRAELRHVVRAALADLPPRQRAVVVLRWFEDLTEAQTAAVLGCSVGAVKTHGSRAVARLRTHPGLAGLFDDRDDRDDLRGAP